MKIELKKITRSYLPRIVAIITLLCVSFVFAVHVFTIIVTAVKLNRINSDITYIEEIAATNPNGWTKELVDEYNKKLSEKKAIYESDNHIVAEFSNANNLKKFFILFINFCMLLLTAYSEIRLVCILKNHIFKLLA